MSEWKDHKLGDLIELLTDYHSNGSYETLKENVELLDKESFAVMIRTKNFEQNDFSKELKYINKHAYNHLSKSKVYPDDIIMNKIANAGSIYRMPELNRPVSLAMNLFLIRMSTKVANQVFMYYFLKQNEKYIKTFAEGSVTKTITKDAVRNLDVSIPELTVQDEIVKTLNSIDQKITLLRQQNHDLEDLAQTLFKRWFVEFEFPNENGEPYKSSGGKMVESELGEIPDGWKLKALESILRIHNGYSYRGSELQESDIALVTLKNFDRNGGFRFDGFKELVSDNYKEKHIVNFGDLIVAHTDLTHDAEVLGNPAIIMKNDKYKELVISMDLVKVESKIDEITTAFLYYLMRDKRFKSHCKGYSNGTTVLHLSKTAIPEYLFAFPENMNLIKYFGQYAKSVYDKISVNIEEIQTLAQLRDMLLPKLMSGELKIKLDYE